MIEKIDHTLAFDSENPETVSLLDDTSIWSAPFGQVLLDTVKLTRDCTALDIGCGLGYPLIELAMRLGSTANVYGIDPWSAAVERARWKVKLLGLKNIEIIEGVAENLPFPEEIFDLIVSNNGLNNVRDFTQVLIECRRVAKTNCQLVFTMNTEETMSEFYDILREVLLEYQLADLIELVKHHIHEKRRPVPEVDRLLEKNGFRIRQKTMKKFYLRYVDGTTMLNHFFIRLAFLESWKQILPETLRTELFRELEHRLNHAAERQGEFRLTIPYITYDCRCMK